MLLDTDQLANNQLIFRNVVLGYFHNCAPVRCNQGKNVLKERIRLNFKE